MRFEQMQLKGAWIVDPVPAEDERGWFARTFCVREFADLGLETRFVQHSTSLSRRARTLRGLHFQEEPHGEVKIVSCAHGAIFDVIVDMRPGSPTRMRWTAVELSARNGRRLYIPKGFAHGFITLSDNVIVNYLISEFYEPSAARGLRYDDPVLAIEWPCQPAVISERDLAWPYLEPEGLI
jgi:dTDP-4-dehydrorhamnose 3,5-epimerase